MYFTVMYWWRISDLANGVHNDAADGFHSDVANGVHNDAADRFHSIVADGLYTDVADGVHSDVLMEFTVMYWWSS